MFSGSVGLSLLLASSSALNSSAKFVYDIVQLLQLGIQGINAVVSQVGSGSREGVDEFFSDLLRDLRTVLVKGSLRVMDNIVKLVSDFNSFLKLRIVYPLLFVLFLHLFSLMDHLVDFILSQTTRRLDDNVLLFTGSLVLGSDLQDTVVINLESNSDLRYTSRVR